MDRTTVALQYESIKTIDHLEDFCDRLVDSEVVAFDTEFVSETTYRPQLCLIQVATDDGLLATIDPLELSETRVFWDRLASGDHTVVAHAAREEIRFCYRYSGKRIENLFDTQLAAGFVGIEYPASLATLVSKLVGKTLPKGQTRTDWSMRPLTKAQTQYALSDVTELVEMYDRLSQRLDRRGRWDWLEEETELLQDKVIEYDTGQNWRRVSGSQSLPPRQLEIVRQLWIWREEVARRQDRLPRRILRDDLIIEIAKRNLTDVKKIRGIRGLERRNLADEYGNLAAAVIAAGEVPDDQLPERPRGHRKSVSPMLAQFLSTSMACLARSEALAPAIVGNNDDIKEFLGYELQRKELDPPPALLSGWRGDIVGQTLRRVLRGELAIRVEDVGLPQPLEFTEVDRDRN